MTDMDKVNAFDIMLACVLCAITCLLIQPGIADNSRKIEITNREFVVAGMTADLQAFGLRLEQAKMLADQTADFGVLGLMTTVAAVGMSTERDRSRVAIDFSSSCTCKSRSNCSALRAVRAT